MQKNTLNDIYSDYVLGDIKRDKFEGIIYTYLLNNQNKTSIKHWKQSNYKDFISWFYPNLKKVIDSYEDVGSSFEAYLYRFMLLSAKEYSVRTITRSITEYSTWGARIPEMYVHEEPPIYKTNNTKEELTKMITEINGKKNKRRILALVIKCYYYVSDDFADKIALLTGIDAKELIEKLNKIRKIRQKTDDRIYLFKERIYCQFYRCIVYERKLSLIREDTFAYEKMRRRLKRARERLSSMRERIKKVRTDATHKQIAEVIGITKGTVDASLHRLKEKLGEMAKKANLN
ncbi:MAG: sigma-70 region 4 domain-containing protein [Spirochaetes bacterium]|nr:sigma-70 region 4 domain-containing protein [Spirochaetota bacterium]